MNARLDLAQARAVRPTSARRLIGEGALLVDVREGAEIERLAFDVPGIVVLPLSEFERRFARLPRDRERVLACQSGARSLKATCFLQYKGYTQVSNLEGGIAKWAVKGFPIKGVAATSTPVAGACCGAQAASSCCSEPDRASVATATAAAAAPPPR